METMTTKPKKETRSVKWGRPVTTRHGDIFYTSKCGRFTIERKEYVLPTVSVAYRLTDTSDDWTADCDSLRDAKGEAEEIAVECARNAQQAP
jgi:hypothetical protein